MQNLKWIIIYNVILQIIKPWFLPKRRVGLPWVSFILAVFISFIMLVPIIGVKAFIFQFHESPTKSIYEYFSFSSAFIMIIWYITRIMNIYGYIQLKIVACRLH